MTMHADEFASAFFSPTSLTTVDEDDVASALFSSRPLTTANPDAFVPALFAPVSLTTLRADAMVRQATTACEQMCLLSHALHSETEACMGQNSYDWAGAADGLMQLIADRL